MTLAAWQRAFAAVLLDRADPASLAGAVHGDARASAEERIAVYAGVYRARLAEVLEEVYPLVRTLLGAARFDAIATAYVYAHPSRSFTLRGFGDRFADHLAGTADAPPAASSLARLCWARYDLFDAVDEPLLSRARLAAIAPDALGALPLRRVAASRLVACEHDVGALYRALAAGAAPGEATATATTFLVWREGTTLYHRVPDDAERALLERLASPVTLAEVCAAVAGGPSVEAAAQQAFALIGRWIADGLLADPG